MLVAKAALLGNFTKRQRRCKKQFFGNADSTFYDIVVRRDPAHPCKQHVKIGGAQMNGGGNVCKPDRPLTIFFYVFFGSLNYRIFLRADFFCRACLGNDKLQERERFAVYEQLVPFDLVT